MASLIFLLILVKIGVIREFFCDNRIIGVFEEDEPAGGKEGLSFRSSDTLSYPYHLESFSLRLGK